MAEIVRIMQKSILEGIAGHKIRRPHPGPSIRRSSKPAWTNGRLLDGGMLNRMILYVTAMMEVKSSMGVIVAAPTAGACGGLPGCLYRRGNFAGLIAWRR